MFDLRPSSDLDSSTSLSICFSASGLVVELLDSSGSPFLPLGFFLGVLRVSFFSLFRFTSFFWLRGSSLSLRFLISGLLLLWAEALSCCWSSMRFCSSSRSFCSPSAWTCFSWFSSASFVASASAAACLASSSAAACCSAASLWSLPADFSESSSDC